MNGGQSDQGGLRHACALSAVQTRGLWCTGAGGAPGSVRRPDCCSWGRVPAPFAPACFPSPPLLLPGHGAAYDGGNGAGGGASGKPLATWTITSDVEEDLVLVEEDAEDLPPMTPAAIAASQTGERGWQHTPACCRVPPRLCPPSTVGWRKCRTCSWCGPGNLRCPVTRVHQGHALCCKHAVEGGHRLEQTASACASHLCVTGSRGQGSQSCKWWCVLLPAAVALPVRLLPAAVAPPPQLAPSLCLCCSCRGDGGECGGGGAAGAAGGDAEQHRPLAPPHDPAECAGG